MAPDGSHPISDPPTADVTLWLALDHDRIAAELNDRVIAPLVRIGLGLSGVAAGADERTMRAVLSYVDGLEDTIRELRSVVFDLTAAKRADHHGSG